MKKTDIKIAEAEAEWRKYRYRDTGVRESAGQLFRAVGKSAGKWINCAVLNICALTKRTCFRPSYDEGKENIVVSLTSTRSRIKNILPTLYSLAAQKRKPDLIVLWLGKDGYYPKRILSGIREKAPRIAYISRIETERVTKDPSFEGFDIVESTFSDPRSPGHGSGSGISPGIFIPPDIAVCPDCMRELYEYITL